MPPTAIVIPLMMAASFDDAETLRALLDAGADIRARDAKGKSALDHAGKGAKTGALLRARAEAAGMSVDD